MKILILGGTQFIGHHIALALLSRGHHVTIFNRGITPDTLPAHVERLRGDRDLGPSGLATLADGTWDACIDVSGYTAVHVRASTELLRHRIRHYVFISAVSVYGDPTQRPVLETHPRSEPAPEEVVEVVGAMYGRLKVTCENIVHDVCQTRAAVLRPQIVVGPGDESGRYTFWLARAAAQGPLLAPGDGTDHVQCIDVRDVAAFACTAVEQALSGPFNLAGPRITWSSFMSTVLKVGGNRLVWASRERIRAAGLTEFELPLYRGEHEPRSGLMDICNANARKAGLILTDPAQTAQSTLAWMQGRQLPSMLPAAIEQELLRQT